MAESGISDENHVSVITATDTLLISTTPRSSSSLFVKWQAFVVRNKGSCVEIALLVLFSLILTRFKHYFYDYECSLKHEVLIRIVGDEFEYSAFLLSTCILQIFHFYIREKALKYPNSLNHSIRS